MKNTNELRLGNWVYDSPTKRFPMQVVHIGYDYAYLDFEGNEGDVLEVDTKDIIGIPLTEELMKNFGPRVITNKPNNITTESNKIIGSEFHTNIVIYTDRGESHIISYYRDTQLNSIMVPWIYSLHELQNLYFALTGKELDVKL